MTLAALPPWGDLDLWNGQRPAAREPIMAQARQALGLGQEAAFGQALDMLGHLSDMEQARLSRWLGQHFSVPCARLLEQTRGLHWKILLDINQRPAQGVLAWALRDLDHVQQVELATEVTTGTVRGMDKARPNLLYLLGQWMLRDPNGTMRELLECDLPSVVRDHGTHHDDLVHLGMVLVNQAMIQADHDGIDVPLMARFIEWCLARDILESAAGHPLDDDQLLDWRVRSVDPIIETCVGSNAYLGPCLVSLGLLEQLLPHAPTLRQALDDYWTLDDPTLTSVAQWTHNEKNGFIKAAAWGEIKKIYPKNWRARNMLDALVRGNHPQITDRLVSDTDMGARFWQVLEHGPNLAAVLGNFYQGEMVRALVEPAIKHLGYEWRDEMGNNLAHLFVQAPRYNERMALMALARKPQGAALFSTPNAAGETPLEVLARTRKFEQDDHFLDRMQRKCSKSQREALATVARKSITHRPRPSASRRM